MITFRKGNIFESNAGALVNTVNTVGVMGKGIALQFKQLFPHNFAVYRKACADHELKIGGLLVVNDYNLILGDKVIINFPTKRHWRNPSEYDFIKLGLTALREHLRNSSVGSIALPPLGCGNGGLNWPVVKEMIYRHLEALDAIIEVYDPA